MLLQEQKIVNEDEVFKKYQKFPKSVNLAILKKKIVTPNSNITER